MKYKTDNLMVKLFAKWAVENVERFLISEGHCYSEVLWMGGGMDLIYIDKSDRTVIMDFKSSKEAYKSQFIQIAFYDLQIAENGVFDHNGEKLLDPRSADYYAVFPFGMPKPEPQFWFNTAFAKEGAVATKKIYDFING